MPFEILREFVKRTFWGIRSLMKRCNMWFHRNIFMMNNFNNIVHVWLHPEIERCMHKVFSSSTMVTLCTTILVSLHISFL